MTGLRSTAAGLSLEQIFPEASARILKASFNRCVAGRKPLKLREWLEFPAGRQHWIAVLTPVQDPDDQHVTHILMTGRDATEDQRLISQLRRSELLAERVARTSPGSVYLFDCATFSYRFLNTTQPPDPRIVTAFVEGLEIQLSDSLLHPDDIPAVHDSRERLSCQPEGTVAPVTFRMAQPEGDYRWVQSREMVLTRDDAGRSAVIVGAAIDVTETMETKDRLRMLAERLLTVQNEERRRIAQELHDSTSQHLTAIGLGVARLRDLAVERAEFAAVIEDMQEMLSETHREIGALTYLLHPPRLDKDGLAKSLRDFLAGFSRRAGLRIEFSADGAIDAITRGWETAPYRIVQEAISNVHRHAGATYATVVVSGAGDAIEIVVTDDGRGLPDEPSPRGGIGIDGMRARVALFGGAFEIQSGICGTTIRARLLRQAEPVFLEAESARPTSVSAPQPCSPR